MVLGKCDDVWGCLLFGKIEIPNRKIFNWWHSSRFFSPDTGFNCICAEFDWKPVNVKFFGREVVRFYVTTNNNPVGRLRSPLRGQRNSTWTQIHKGRKLGFFFKKGSISTSEGSVESRGWDLIFQDDSTFFFQIFLKRLAKPNIWMTTTTTV